VRDAALRDRLRDRLAQVGDPERLLGRAVLGSLTPREAAALRDGLAVAPAILADLAAANDLTPTPRDAAPLLAELSTVDPLPALHRELARLLVETPPGSLGEGGVIAAGVDSELDRCRSLANDSKRHILNVEP